MLWWSLVVSAVLLIVIYIMARAVFYSYVLGNLDLNTVMVWLNYYVGYPVVYVLFGLPLFLLVYWLLVPGSKRVSGAQISKRLIRIRWRDGHFDHQVQVDPNTELGQLAANINRLVAQLQQSMHEERKAEQTKNELITNVSHDLRTPLTSITGYLGLVDQDRYRDEVELRYYVSMAYEESLRLNQLIQDLFEYTRLRNNEMKLRLEKINLIEMLRQITEQFHPIARSADGATAAI